MRVVFRVVPIVASAVLEFFNPARAIPMFVAASAEAAAGSAISLSLEAQLEPSSTPFASSMDRPDFLKTVLMSRGLVNSFTISVNVSTSLLDTALRVCVMTSLNLLISLSD